MTPTWESDCGTVKLWCGDCLDVMATWPDGAVDAVVTDPPYGIGYKGQAWDDEVPRGAVEYMASRFPVSLVHCGQGELWKYPEPDWTMAWFMPGSVRRTRGGKFKHWEPVLVYGRESHSVDSKVFPCQGGANVDHPCPKPTMVAYWLVKECRGTIADPFMGSGTTGVAAVRLGRQFWGVELDAGYFEIAKRRIQDELRKVAFLEPTKTDTQREMFA